MSRAAAAEPTVDTHTRLRREAARLFAERGYGGASMSLIAERVGVRKASLYNYYASKEDLLIDLLESSVGAWEAACRPAVDQDTTCEAMLASVVGNAVRFADQNPQRVAIIRLAASQIGGDLGRRVRKILDAHEKEWIASLNRLFAQAVERGEVKATDPVDLTLFWAVFIDGLLINQLFGTAKAKDLRAHLPCLWEYFWRGVSGRKPRTEPLV